MIPGSTRGPRVDFGGSPKSPSSASRRTLHASGVRSPIFFAAALLVVATGLRAAEIIPPKPERYFNDYASVVSQSAGLRFNERLAQFERETSNQVVVAVFPKMQSESDIADYTQRVAQAWGVGQQERRNGVVLFVFTEDRKMFIQVGYGLEGALPDATAFDIAEYRIKPRFRSGDYEGGLTVGIESILQAIRGEYTGSGRTTAERRTTKVDPSVWVVIWGLVIFLILQSIIRRVFGGYTYSSRRRGPIFIPMGFGGGSGGWSSGGGGFSGFSGGGGSFGGGGAGSSW